MQAVSAPPLCKKNDRVALIRVMTKDKEWKGVRRGGLIAEGWESLITFTLCLHLSIWVCPREIPLLGRIGALGGDRYLFVVN